MKNLISSLVLVIFVSSLSAQNIHKQNIEVEGQFVPMTGVIGKIEKSDVNTTVFINARVDTSHIILPNSKVNYSFLQYIKIGDMINLKQDGDIRKVAVFKRQDGVVKVKIYYAVESE